MDREKLIKNLGVNLSAVGLKKYAEIGCSHSAWLDMLSSYIFLPGEIDMIKSIDDPEILGTINRVDFRKTNIPDDWFNITSAYGWRHANVETGISHPSYLHECLEQPCCIYSVMMD